MPYALVNGYVNYTLPLYLASGGSSLSGWGSVLPVIGTLRKGTNTSADWECVSRNAESGSGSQGTHEYINLGDLKTVIEVGFTVPNGFDLVANSYELTNPVSPNAGRKYRYTTWHVDVFPRTITAASGNIVHRYTHDRFGSGYNPVSVIQAHDTAWGRPAQWGNKAPYEFEIDVKGIGDALYSNFAGKNAYIFFDMVSLFTADYDVGELYTDGVRLLRTEWKYGQSGPTSSYAYGDYFYDNTKQNSGMGRYWPQYGFVGTGGVASGKFMHGMHASVGQFAINDAHSAISWTMDFIPAFPSINGQSWTYAAKRCGIRFVIAVSTS